MSEVLLEARHLSKDFPLRRGRVIHAVSDVSLTLYAGETLALVGESGCGKSTLGRLLLRLIAPTGGDILLRGKSILDLPEREWRPFRRQLQLIFQDPYGSLNPRMTVRDLIAEPLTTWHICSDREQTTAKVLELMDAVGLPRAFLYLYPHQFSGGQRQRIGIARALACDPALIVCDEPVSALDISVQNQILNLLRELQQQRKLTYLFISHDLSVVRHLSDRVSVMFLGMLCETGPTEAVFHSPLHPYTRLLLNAVPQPDPTLRDKPVQLLTGDVPSPVHPPSGCRFHPRCPYASSECTETPPEPKVLGDRQIACHHPLPLSGSEDAAKS